MHRPRSAAAALLCVTLTLAGCGRSDDESAGSGSPTQDGTTGASGTAAGSTASAGSASPSSPGNGGPGSPSSASPAPPARPDPVLPQTGNPNLDVTAYDLTLDAGSAATDPLTATAVLTVVPRTTSDTLRLDLRGLTVDEVTVAGAPARHSRAGQHLTITPATPLAAGQQVQVRIRYSGTPTPYLDAAGARCGWLPNQDLVVALNEPNCASTWFPVNDTPADKASFRITTTVDNARQVVSNGKLTEKKAAGTGRTTYVWTVPEPMAPYLATVVIGRLRTSSATTASGVPVLTAVQEGVSPQTAASLQRIPEMIAFLEQRYGAFPFSSTGAVVTAPGIPYALETQNRVFLGSMADESTLLHELAHEWWGNSVSPTSWGDLWINEGMATLAEWEWAAAQGGPSVDAQAKAVIDRPASDPFWTTVVTRPGPAQLFTAPVYTRSAAFFTRLRATMGEQAFTQLRKRWVADHRHGNAGTAELEQLAEELTGKELTPLFNAWVRSAAKPS